MQKWKQLFILFVSACIFVGCANAKSASVDAKVTVYLSRKETVSFEDSKTDADLLSQSVRVYLSFKEPDSELSDASTRADFYQTYNTEQLERYGLGDGWILSATEAGASCFYDSYRDFLKTDYRKLKKYDDENLIAVTVGIHDFAEELTLS